MNYNKLICRMEITNRAHEFGAGDGKNAVVLLLANFCWSSWTPTTFYAQLLISAFTCLSQSGSSFSLWKAFLVGRVSFSRVILFPCSWSKPTCMAYYSFPCFSVLVPPRLPRLKATPIRIWYYLITASYLFSLLTNYCNRMIHSLQA